jgi:hypothetical protein
MSNRTVFVNTSCGCQTPGIARALEKAEFEKAAMAQARRPGRRRPVLTSVGRYVSRNEAALSRKITKALRAHARKVAHALAAAVGVKKADSLSDDVLAILRANSLSEQIVSIIKPEMIKAYRTAAHAGIAQVGFDASEEMTKQVDAEAVFWAANRGGELMKDFANTTDEDLRGLLSRAVEEGMTTDELEDEIMNRWSFGEVRASMIARTELAFAHVQGNLDGWRATGEVEGKRWILGDLHDVEDICDECADMGVIGIDEEFADGISAPPGHPNCFCDLIPVLKDAQELGGEDDGGD